MLLPSHLIVPRLLSFSYLSHFSVVFLAFVLILLFYFFSLLPILCLSFFSVSPSSHQLSSPSQVTADLVGADCQHVCPMFRLRCSVALNGPFVCSVKEKKKKTFPTYEFRCLPRDPCLNLCCKIFFFLWSTKEIIALSLTNRTWLLSPHTPESWCKSWAVPSACINLIRKTPFQSWSLEDAHWGRFCREVAQWKHFLQHWVPKEIGWRLHLCYNKKEYFFLGGTFSDCSNCHWQWAVLGTWVLQWPHWSFKTSLGTCDFWVLWVSYGL